MAIMSITQANQVFIVISPLASFLVSDSGHAVGSFPHYTDIHPSDTHRDNTHSYLKSGSNLPIVGVPWDHLS